MVSLHVKTQPKGMEWSTPLCDLANVLDLPANGL